MPAGAGGGFRRCGSTAALLAVLVLAASPLAAQNVAAPPRVPQPLGWQETPVATPAVAAKVDSLIGEFVDIETTLYLDPERSRILRTKKPVTRMSITDPAVLEAVQFSPTEWELIGGRTGQTSLTLWFAAPDGGHGEMIRYLVRVSPNTAIEDRRQIEYEDFEAKLNELFPGSTVQLIPVSDKLIVRGQARDSEEAAQILAMVTSGASGANGMIGAGGVVAAGSAAPPYPGTSDLPQSTVINMLEVPGEMQVLLKVRVAELSRSALREMGAKLNLDLGDFALSTALGANGAIRAVLDTEEFRLALQALSTNSYSKILAEPNLVTLSGHPAYFIAGGEFAVPIVVGVEGAAASTTTFRGFGTQLTFLPTVIDKDRIRLQVSPSFSTLNQGNAVNGIPGLDTRAVSTTVDLREGQWLAIAGLLEDQQHGSKARVPFAGDVPVLDTIFSRKESKRDETELLVLVSPELVHPLSANEAPRILPGMEVTEPGDVAFFFGGNYEGKPNCHHRSTVWPVLQREIYDAHCQAKRDARFQKCEGYYIQGSHGFSR
ncbi:MAG: hypothetical protein GXY83_23260 [Rhodopirellula sp.]|nr:hypothetical protein [Rhodopirellula sp.]